VLFVNLLLGAFLFCLHSAVLQVSKGPWITIGKPKALFFNAHNRAWLLIGGPHSGRWVLPERHSIPYWLLWQLNGNKN